MLKCPSCLANLRFDIPSQMMYCDHCSQSFDPYLFEKMEKDAVLMGGDEQAGETGLYETAEWTCPGCGAVVTYADMTDVTAVCAYCGNRNIIFERIRKERRPETIIPFSVTKEDCKKKYIAAARRAFLSPSALRKKAQVDSFRGIYMPYWNYQIRVKDRFRVQYSGKSRRSGDYILTDIMSLNGDADAEFDGLSYDASSQFDDSISETIAPYHTKDERRFTPGFLSGFYAETYDMTDGIQERKHAEELARTGILRKLEGTYRMGRSVNEQSMNVGIPRTTARRSLFPVWFMSYRMGNGKMTYAAINGSTGKAEADFPISFPRLIVCVLALAGLLFLALNFAGGMTRPVPALMTTGILYLLGSFLNGKVLKEVILKKLLSEKERTELKPTFLSSAPKAMKIFLAVFAGHFLLLFCMFMIKDGNSACRFVYLMAFLITAVFRVKAFLKEKAALQKVKWTKTSVKYGDFSLVKKMSVLNLVLILTVGLVTMVVLFSNVMNEWYYIMAGVDSLAFLAQFFFTVKMTNFMVYRRPPQFNKKGGDDSAN